MPRPKTKEELIDLSETNYQKLLDIIDSMGEELVLKEFLFEDRDRVVRDVVVHLFEWHLLLLRWIKENTSGNNIHFLPDGYNWKNYGLLNMEFFKKHQNTSLEDALSMLKKTHMDSITLISSFSNDQLFVKKHFDWTGSTSLGSYCVSSLSSHYDWALKKLKKHIKTNQG